MIRPPECVRFVARVHGVVSLIVVGSGLFLYWVTRDLPGIQFGLRTHLLTGGLALIYGMAAALVWLGAPLAPVLSRICCLLYLPRPSFGLRVWRAMELPEFRAYFHPKR